jgi:hypothetical protein
MNPNPGKARWARRKAAECAQAADAIDTVPAADYRGVRDRMKAQAHLRAEERRYLRMAEDFERGTWKRRA